MSRKYRDVRNTGFSLGVIAEENLANPNTYRQSLKAGTNAYITNSGTLLRRPGSELNSRISFDPSPATQLENGRLNVRTRTVDMSNGEIYHVHFVNQYWYVLDASGALVSSGAGPWGDDDLYTMTIVVDINALYIVSEAFFPRSLLFNEDTELFLLSEYVFDTDPNGRKASPFGRFSERGVTIQPSAYQGVVTVTFSSPILNPDYVGTRFIVAFGAQVEITGYISPTEADAIIYGTVFPTQVIGVESTSPFTIGDVIQGDTTGIQAQVVEINVNSLTVVNVSEFTLFSPPVTQDEVDVPGEAIAGPGGNTVVTSVVQSSVPAATNIWFEEIISPARGYPRTATLHRNRMVFGGFPNLPNTIAASATNSVGNFDVNQGDTDDGFIEAIGNNTNEKIKHLVSLEQLIVLTDERALYVPEAQNLQFTPNGVSFDNIGPEIAGYQQPAISSEGVLFIDKYNRVILLSITGASRGTWRPLELTRLSYNLFVDPISIVFSAGIRGRIDANGRPERVLVVMNNDGSLVVFTYPRGAEVGGWVPWKRDDLWHSITSLNGELYAVSGSVELLAMDIFTFDCLMDSQFEVGSLNTPFNAELNYLEGDFVMGSINIDGAGNIIEDTFDDTVDGLGNDFDVEIIPAPYANENIGRLRRRIYTVYIDVLDTGTFYCEGELIQRYDFTTNVNALPPIHTGNHEIDFLADDDDGDDGSDNSVIVLSQKKGEGSPFHLRALTMKIKGS